MADDYDYYAGEAEDERSATRAIEYAGATEEQRIMMDERAEAGALPASRGGAAVAEIIPEEVEIDEPTTELVSNAFQDFVRTTGEVDFDMVKLLLTIPTERAKAKFSMAVGEVVSRFESDPPLKKQIIKKYEDVCGRYPNIIDLNPSVLAIVFYHGFKGGDLRLLLKEAKELLNINPADIIRYYRFLGDEFVRR